MCGVAQPSTPVEPGIKPVRPGCDVRTLDRLASPAVDDIGHVMPISQVRKVRALAQEAQKEDRAANSAPAPPPRRSVS